MLLHVNFIEIAFNVMPDLTCSVLNANITSILYLFPVETVIANAKHPYSLYQEFVILFRLVARLPKDSPTTQSVATCVIRWNFSNWTQLPILANAIKIISWMPTKPAKIIVGMDSTCNFNVMTEIKLQEMDAVQHASWSLVLLVIHQFTQTSAKARSFCSTKLNRSSKTLNLTLLSSSYTSKPHQCTLFQSFAIILSQFNPTWN